MAECTPEFWTLKDIKDCLEKGWNGNKKIVSMSKIKNKIPYVKN